MKNFQIKKINPFDRNFFYKEEAEEIADCILSLLSQGTSEFEDYIHWRYDCPILNDSNIIIWSFNILKDDSDFIKQYKYDIWATAGANESDEPSIHVTIILPKRQWIKNQKIKREALIGVISHEIHHIAQNNFDDVDNSNFLYENSFVNPTKKILYLISDIEIEAFNIGARAESFYSGKDEAEIMMNYLICLNINDSDAKKIINIWANTQFEILRKNLGEI